MANLNKLRNTVREEWQKNTENVWFEFVFSFSVNTIFIFIFSVCVEHLIGSAQDSTPQWEIDGRSTKPVVLYLLLRLG